MTPSPEIYKLPADPRANACGTFFDDLKSKRGVPLQINASAVDRVDTLVMQVLVLGARTWAADDLPFTLVHPSEPMTSALARLGLTDAVTTERTQNDD